MQIRITRTIKKVGLFRKSIELEETLFLYTDIHDDNLFPLIHAIGKTVTDHSLLQLKDVAKKEITAHELITGDKISSIID